MFVENVVSFLYFKTTMNVPEGVLNSTAVYAEDAEDTQVGEVQMKLEGIQGASGALQRVQIIAITNRKYLKKPMSKHFDMDF